MTDYPYRNSSGTPQFTEIDLTQSNGILVWDGTKFANYAGPQIDTSGRMVNAQQPACTAYSCTGSNVTGDGTQVVPIFGGTTFDNTSSYNNSTGVFTAPVAGRYLIQAMITLEGAASDNTFANMWIVGANKTFEIRMNPYAISTGGQFTMFLSAIDHINASGGINMRLAVNGHATKNISFSNDGGSDTYNWMSIALLN